jgi:amino acid permease
MKWQTYLSVLSTSIVHIHGCQHTETQNLTLVCTHEDPKPTLNCKHAHRTKLTLIYMYTDLKSNLGWHTQFQSITALYTHTHTHTDSKLNLSLQKHRPNRFPWFKHTQTPTLLCSLCFIYMLAVVTSVCD